MISREFASLPSFSFLMGPSNLQTRVTKHISHLVRIDIPYVVRVGYVGEDVPMSL